MGLLSVNILQTQSITLNARQIQPSYFSNWLTQYKDDSQEIINLKTSIKNIGLINPPIVYPIVDNNYFLLSGYKRYQALLNLNRDKIECSLIKNSLSDVELLLIYIFDNIAHRNFSPLEISEFLNYFSQNLPENKIITEILPIFKIRSSKDELKKYLILSSLNEDEKIAVKAEIYNVKTARNLINLSNDNRKTLLKLYEEIKPSVSYQQIILELLMEIAKRDKITFRDIISEKDIERFVSDRKISPQQKTFHLREYLERRRRPIFSKAVDEFNKIIKSLRLPKNIKIQPSEFFEDEEWILSAKFKNIDELKKINEFMRKNEDKLDMNFITENQNKN